ncbi:heavy metal translocatin [Viridothelium virens]|uniref:P-type Cu(+) transporter n=1 Tax=Viridothelium virens TaxID=1048519 RepID=A0A6A6H4J1_VIRVR|nr:heavy metal translocatin [Viridothelium virens]
MPQPKSSLTAHLATTTLKVGGMTCGACTSAVESGFSDVSGIGSVSVSLVMERAVVQHDPSIIPAEKIAEIIEDRGFDAQVLNTDLPTPDDFDIADDSTIAEDDEEPKAASSLCSTTVQVGGMTCGACTSAVEGGFKDVPGVKTFSISLLSERAVLEHDSSILSSERIAEIIEDTGFDANVLESKSLSATPSSPGKKRKRGGKQAKIATTTVSVEGMTCGACTSAVEGGFQNVEGLVHFNISLLAERAVIIHDQDKLPADKIAEIIEDRGFDAKILSSVLDGAAATSDATASLKIYGLNGPESAQELETRLRNLPGVTSASVSFGTSRATIAHAPSSIGLRGIVEVIENAGYNALVAENDDNNAQLESLAKTKEIQEWHRNFFISLSFAIPVFLTSMIFPMVIPFLDYGSIKLPIVPGLWLGDVVCLALTIPVQFGIGKRFYVSAFKSLRHGSPTMDVLVVLGTSAAFFFSVAAMIVSILSPPHTRPATVFDTSTMLITFITLGRYLENRAKGQTSKALSRLMSLAPSMATIYADPIAAAKAAEGWDNQTGLSTEKPASSKEDVGVASEERVIPTELIETGDIVILKPGDKIPADGTVTRGESYIDESMVTGEAMPILKKKGSLLMAGTVNGAGRLDFRVTRAGRDTQLSQIVRLVQEAQTSRAPIQRMADTIAGYFVPIIIVLGLSTFVAWMILSHVLKNPPSIFLDHESGGRFMVCLKLCIAVIVFACPCALGLATPTAVMVGTGVGAEQGILVKGGAALETATKITHVVLDKTGTLTMGKMSVANSRLLGGWDESPKKSRLWWTLIGLAEMSSEHPIAKAIVNGAKEHLNLGPEGALDGSVGDFDTAVGKGISAHVEAAISPERKRYKVLVGNTSFLRANGVSIPASIDAEGNHDPFSSSTASPSASRSSLDADKPAPTTPAAKTTIHTAIDAVYTGTLALADTLKPSAPAAIAALRRMNVSASIVTGDQLPAARHVAALVGIAPHCIHAGVVPAGKQAIVEELQAAGEVVAMVGDGINDSPALATADIGISLASGTDVAMEAADVVLMRPEDLLDIPASLHLSRTIFTRIRLNLAWACLYNAIGLPFAMGFFLPWGLTLHPLAAGAAMACSSVSVVGSSLLLKWWRRPGWMSEVELSQEIREGIADVRSMGKGTRVGSKISGGLKDRVLDKLAVLMGRKRQDAVAYTPLRNFETV